MAIKTRETTADGVTNNNAPLTNAELDNNFVELQQNKADLSGANFTGDIDVTGTVTADTDIRVDGASPSLYLMESDTTDLNTRLRTSNGDFIIDTGNDAQSTVTNRFRIDHSTGDISFYEDTGTTAKLTWDASAESLMLGTTDLYPYNNNTDTSADNGIVLRGGIGKIDISRYDGIPLDINRTGSDGELIAFERSGSRIGSIGCASSGLTFDAGGSTERMRIDSSGNVGIGTSSPNYPLDVAGIGRFRGSNGANAAYFGQLSHADYTKVDFLTDTLNNSCYLIAYGSNNAESGNIALKNNTGDIFFATNNAERMRIDSSGNVILSHGLTENVFNTVTALDPTNGGIQYKTLSANTTFTDSLSNGESMTLRLEGGATYTVTYPTMTWISASGNVAPTLNGTKDTLVFWKENSTLYGAYVGYGA